MEVGDCAEAESGFSFGIIISGTRMAQEMKWLRSNFGGLRKTDLLGGGERLG